MIEENITENERKIIEGRVAGKSYRAIAKEANVSVGTVARALAKHREYVAEMQRSTLEESLQAMMCTRFQRIKNLGDLLGRLENELTTERLRELSAAQLIDRLTKVHQAFDKMVSETRFVRVSKDDIGRDNLPHETVRYLDVET